VDNEAALVKAVVHLVRVHDPDILAGWEVQKASWGFLFKRVAKMKDQAVLGVSFALDCELSRLYPSEPGDARHFNDEWGERKASEIHIVGRLVFNVWRLMRSELTLSSYTIQNVAAQTLRVRLPDYKHPVLHEWVTRPTLGTFDRAIGHSILLASTTLEVLEHLDFVNRTSEFARMYGMDLMSVITRGSQYRVEAVMLRILRRMADQNKNEAYVLPSPSAEDVAAQRGLAAIAVNMEPDSQLHTAPVAVLDYQSLYPSIMISRNICFSTCLGRMHSLVGVAHGADTLLTDDEAAQMSPASDAREEGSETPSSDYFAPRLGVLEAYCPSIHAVQSVKQIGGAPDVFIADNGVVFVGKETRKGVLPRMLEDILTMRVLVKQTLKEAQNRKDKTVARILESRQLGLKLLANVTYGYTAASFSGRMPCVEIADAIVLTGRAIWHDTTAIVHSKWRSHDAKVVYGDTDSVFVLLPHANVGRAFEIGAQIAKECTDRHPSPVKLKLEKVYERSILATKKRYAGYMHEYPHGQEAVLDMKGIHAVRRDGFPALVKIMKRVLHILFSTLDMSLVRSYVQRQCRKILNNTVSLQDLILRQELKGAYRQPPPHAVVVTKMVYHDPQAQPVRGERVPYMIVYGSDRATIRELAVPPEDLLSCKDWAAGAAEASDGADRSVVAGADDSVDIPASEQEKERPPGFDDAAVRSFAAMARQFHIARAKDRRPVGRAAVVDGVRKPGSGDSKPGARHAPQKYIPNGLFYVRRINQALDSILRLCKNTDCYEWTKNLGRQVATRNRRFNLNALQQAARTAGNPTGTIDGWAHTLDCANCFRKTNNLFCDECLEDEQALHANAMYRLSQAQNVAALRAAQCSACAERGAPRVVEEMHLVGAQRSFACGGGVLCVSLDCPAYYARLRAAAQLRFAALASSGLPGTSSGDHHSAGGSC
jgi:DNA polymerase zeta